MSGIKKGSAPKAKPAGATAAGAKKPAGATQPKKPAGGGGGGGSGAGKKKGSSSLECFAGCGVKGAPEAMIEHYEKCFSTNEIKHIQALSDKLDPHFGDPTHCQICNSEFPHSGLLLQHIFAVATGKKKAPGPAGAAAAAHAAEVHGTLFSSFVQELITLPMVGKEEATEYLLSLVVPDYDPTGGEDDDEDDEENDLYEDDEEGDDDEEDEDVDMEERAAFEQFMAMQGIDLGAMAASQGGRGGPGGKKGKIQFLKEMMRQMGGGGDEDEEDDDDDEQMHGRGAKAKAKGAKGKPAAKGAGAAAAATAASAAPAGSNAPGDLKCGSCDQMRSKDLYSSAQIKKKGQRRCKYCVEGTGGGAAASAPSSAEPSPHKPTASAGKGAAAAAASSSAASAKPAAAAASSSSSSGKSNPSAAHSLHRHHAATHHYANGDAIHSEPEETGDGEAHAMEDAAASDDEEEDEDESDEDEEDEDDEDDDPFAAMFGGGRRSGGGRAAAKARSKAAAAKMGMRVVVERPGQALTRDRRLRLKPSKANPVRCWQPHDGQAKCSVCAWRLPSRLIRGWELVCLRCALQHDWIEDEEAPSDEEDEEAHSDRARARKLTLAPRVAYHASTFPNYRAGITKCPRASCGSSHLLVVYDEKGDEYVICAACKGAKQKLRYFDSMTFKLVDSLQEPTTHD